MWSGQHTDREKAETAEVEVQKAVELAAEVADLCVGYEFRVSHVEACRHAAELLADKDPRSGSNGSQQVYVVAEQLHP